MGIDGPKGEPGEKGDKGDKGESGLDVITTSKGVKRSVTRLRGGTLGYAELIAIKGLASMGLIATPRDILLMKGPPGPIGPMGPIGPPGPLGKDGLQGP
ncbi:hypothetical protein DERF_011797, partial [Dermatophagoides farinae]